MTATRRRTKPLTVRVEQPVKLKHSARLYGAVRVIAPALREVACPSMYDHRLHCYVVPKDKRLDDVLAAVELAGHVVDVEMPGWTS